MRAAPKALVGLGIPASLRSLAALSKGGVALSAQARQYIERAGPLPQAWHRYYNDLVNGLVDDGLWPLIDRLSVYDTKTETAALQNIRQDLWNGAKNGTLTFAEEGGFTGDGSTGYISTGYAPASSVGSVATQDSTGVFVWSATDSAATVAETGNSKTSIGLRSATGNLSARVHVVSAVTEPVTTSLGMWGAVRTSSTQHVIYQDGQQLVTETSSSTTPATDAVYDLARNNAGVLTTPSARQIRAVAYTAGLTVDEVATLNGRVQAFFDKIARQDLVEDEMGALTPLNGSYVTWGDI